MKFSTAAATAGLLTTTTTKTTSSFVSDDNKEKDVVVGGGSIQRSQNHHPLSEEDEDVTVKETNNNNKKKASGSSSSSLLLPPPLQLLAIVGRSKQKQQRRNHHPLQHPSMGMKKSFDLPQLMSCDPLSDDPDIGILSCERGYICTMDESSELGGTCTAMSFLPITMTMMTSRNLHEYCDLCGYGKYVPYLNSYVPLTSGYYVSTCGELQFAAYGNNMTNATIDDYSCPKYATLAKKDECCEYFQGCNLCGYDAPFYGEALIESPGVTVTCESVRSNLSPEECIQFGINYVPYCCGPDPTTETPTPYPTYSPQGSKTKPPAPTPPTMSPTTSSEASVNDKLSYATSIRTTTISWSTLFPSIITTTTMMVGVYHFWFW